MRSWKLTIGFRARVPGDATSYYVIQVALGEARRCGSGVMLSPVARDIAAGELVRHVVWIPARCHGRVRGTVSFHQPDPRHTDPAPFVGVPGSGPRVGTFAARIPR
jgi:hypothetical protein